MAISHTGMAHPLRIAAAALFIFAAAAPASARSPDARLVSCGADNCLLVRGHRASPRAEVRINGRPVDVRGGTAWRVALPVATVRDWSAAYARTLHVAIAEPGADTANGTTVRLPIGMFARPIELASLIVRAR